MTSGIDKVILAMKNGSDKDISPFDESFLAKSLEKRLAATSSKSVREYIQYLSDNPWESDRFYQSLIVVYSEFFRNPFLFSFLEQHILPSVIERKIKAGKPEIRVWSAGCAAGQESYSIAILLDELIGKRDITLDFRVFATDISDDALERARVCEYNLTDIENVRTCHLRKYFQVNGEIYTVIDEIKDKVDFSRYDLLDSRLTSPPAGIYGDFDLVICSNILFYYRPGIQKFILDKLYSSLSVDGYLVTDETEQSIVEKANRFQSIAKSTGVYLKMKKTGGV